jgi:hypothetical protein
LGPLGFAAITVVLALAWIVGGFGHSRLNDPAKNGAILAGLAASVRRIPQSDFFDCRLQGNALIEPDRGRFSNSGRIVAYPSIIEW